MIMAVWWCKWYMRTSGHTFLCDCNGRKQNSVCVTLPSEECSEGAPHRVFLSWVTTLRNLRSLQVISCHMLPWLKFHVSDRAPN